MPFGMKNAPTMFFRIVVVVFKDFMDKVLEVYLDVWTVFSLVKEHMEAL